MCKGLAKVFGKGGNPDYSSDLRHLQKAWLTGLTKVQITTTVLALACNDTAWHQTMPRGFSTATKRCCIRMQGYLLEGKQGGTGVKPCSVCMMETQIACVVHGPAGISCASSIAGGPVTGLSKVPIATTFPVLRICTGPEQVLPWQRANRDNSSRFAHLHWA